MLRRDQTPSDPDYYDVSFSGLKTAVLNATRAAGLGARESGTGNRESGIASSRDGSNTDSRTPNPSGSDSGFSNTAIPDIARGFQDALVDTLVEKTARAVAAYDRRRVVLGGGVAGNQTLVAAMSDRLRNRGVEVFAPAARLATDNAAMIARAGLYHLERGERSPLDLNAFASLPLPGLVPA